jgi:hypothetical protein
MGHFRSELVAVKVKEPKGGRANWKLHHPLIFWSTVLNATVTVPTGFITDFASVPRLPFTYWLFGDTAHASAVIHDYLLREMKLDWPNAALVFREAMEAEGVPAWRRWAMYTAVRFPRSAPPSWD